MFTLKKALYLLALCPALAYGAFRPVRPQNLILYCAFDDKGGTTVRDYSSYGSSVGFIGGVAWVIDPGGYATLNGTQTYSPTNEGAVYFTETAGVGLRTDLLSRLNFNTGDFSVVFVGGQEKIGTGMLFMQYVGGAGGGCGGVSGWAISTQASGLMDFNNCSAGANYTWGNVIKVPLFPHMYGASRRGTTLRLYIDGQLQSTVLGISDFGNAGTQSLIIAEGNASIAPSEWVGKLSTVAMWNTGLADDEMQTMYHSQFNRQVLP